MFFFFSIKKDVSHTTAAGCGQNEEYTDCGSCEPTCEQPRVEACAAVSLKKYNNYQYIIFFYQQIC